MNYSFLYPAGLAVPAAASMAPVVAEGTQLQFDPAQARNAGLRRRHLRH
jgi:hypothetical protein